jgi:dissimilatory sulfite reductase (desulfoviridin) alpha/beta subunit
VFLLPKTTDTTMSGEFKLANGSLLLSTEAPGGIYNSEQLKKIALLCEGESAVVKATEDQRIALFVPADKAGEIAEELQSIGLGIRNYQDGLHQPTTCIGEMCSEHLQDAMGSAMDLTAKLAPINLGTPLKIGINGCASCCVPTHTLDISLIGDMNGYRVSLGGKNSQIPEMASFMAEGVPTDKLCDMVESIVNIYSELCEEEESLQDVMERCGSSKFIEALAPYSQDAAGDDPMDMLSSDVDEAETTEDVATEEENEAEEEDVLNLDDLPHADDEDVEVSEDISEEESEAENISDDDFSDVDDLDSEVSEDVTEEVASVDAISEDEFSDAEPLDDSDTEVLDIEEVSMEDIENDDSVLSADSLMSDHEDNMSASSEEEVEDDSFGDDEVIAIEDETSEDEIEISEVDEDDNFDDIEDMEAEEFSDEEEDAFEEKINASIDDQESIGDVEDPNSGERMEAMKLVEDVAPANLAPINSQGVAWSFNGLNLTAEGRVVLQFGSGAEVMLDPSSIPAGEAKEYNLGGQKVTLTPGIDGLTVDVDGMSCFLPSNAARAS